MNQTIGSSYYTVNQSMSSSRAAPRSSMPWLGATRKKPTGDGSGTRNAQARWSGTLLGPGRAVNHSGRDDSQPWSPNGMQGRVRFFVRRYLRHFPKGLGATGFTGLSVVTICFAGTEVATLKEHGWTLPPGDHAPHRDLRV